MTVNPPRSVRVVLYVLTLIGTPVAVYLKAKGLIGDLELGLWGAEVTAVNAMAALNVSNPAKDANFVIKGDQLIAAIKADNRHKGRGSAGI